MNSYTKSKKEEMEKEKETECIYEDESESESESDFEDEEDKKIYNELFEPESFKSSNGEYKVVKICLVPFIFTEEYKKINGLTLDTKISHYSALDKINNYIISENQFKLIEDQIKKKISRILNTDTKNIKIKLDKSKYYFEYKCYVKLYKKVLDINEEYYSELEFSLFKKTDDEFVKYYEETYEKEYKANPDYKLLDTEFKYLEDYLIIYLENIYIRRNVFDYPGDVLNIINRNCNFINPFQFIENTIAFKKIKTKSKDVTKTTIMKMGFIFSYVSEITKE